MSKQKAEKYTELSWVMTPTFRCPACDEIIQRPDQGGGKTRCPRCNRTLKW